MKWAIEIQKYSLERHNLIDLLEGLGFELIEGVKFEAMYSPCLDGFETTTEVWGVGKELRNAFTGPAAIDPDFALGAVIEYSSDGPKRHVYLEPKSVHMNLSVGAATLTISPPSDLSNQELKEWKEKQENIKYKAKLERQRERIEPVFWEPKVAKIIETIDKENHTGESLYKAYEIMEGHPNNRKNFQRQFGISKHEFKRFGDTVHNPVVSGDKARHAYKGKTKTDDPMSFQEAENFISALSKRWLVSIREKEGK